MAQAAQSNQSNISDGLLVKMRSHIVILVKLDLCLHLYRPKLGKCSTMFILKACDVSTLFFISTVGNKLDSGFSRSERH